MSKPVTPEMHRPVLYALILGLLTFVLFSPVRHHEFINYDDTLYITESPLVLDGLSVAGIKRALLEPHAFMWHPLTTVSHQLDITLFGLDAGAHHLMNVLIHAVSTGLLFLLLRSMTGSLWRALIVAALFAWHPLRVESVAWISERKDTLCTLFWILTLFAYVRYVRHATKQNYLLLFVTYLFGIMTKPLIVTLPCLLLLLDVWPLKRFPSEALSGVVGFKTNFGRIRQLVMEKLPLFGLAFALACLTWHSQSSGGIIRTMGHFTLGERLGNAVVSYVRYLGKLFWPQDLVVFYPHPGQWPLPLVMGAVAVLLFISVWVYRRRLASPWELVGWFWFLGLLVPAIGIVQAGGQAMADRYSYFSTVGVLVAVIWSAGEWLKKQGWPTAGLVGTAVLPLLVCVGLTHGQLKYWRNSETLFRHTLAASPGNVVGYENLGSALIGNGKINEGIAVMIAGLQVHPGRPLLHSNLGLAYARLGQKQAAAEQYRLALASDPDYASARSNLGNLLRENGDAAGAVRELETALKSEPHDAEIMNNLALALEETGRKDEAYQRYHEAIQANPRYAEARLNLGVLLYENKNLKEALPLFQQAVALKPELIQAHMALFFALAESGKLADARQAAVVAWRLAERQNRPDLIAELNKGLVRYGLPKP
jgi:tetratricopeptide (TPR) repeat protein